MNESVERAILHSWSYVVIPADKDYTPLFVAYCKHCDKYVSKWVKTPNQPNEIFQGQIGLPDKGCARPYG